jgi:hypothetical protein
VNYPPPREGGLAAKRIEEKGRNSPPLLVAMPERLVTNISEPTGEPVHLSVYMKRSHLSHGVPLFSFKTQLSGYAGTPNLTFIFPNFGCQMTDNTGVYES